MSWALRAVVPRPPISLPHATGVAPATAANSIATRWVGFGVRAWADAVAAVDASSVPSATAVVATVKERFIWCSVMSDE